MSMTRNIIIGVGGLILFGIFSSFFTVNQTQQALVLQFGYAQETHHSATKGLH